MRTRQRHVRAEALKGDQRQREAYQRGYENLHNGETRGAPVRDGVP
jgi:hypothetical protein